MWHASTNLDVACIPPPEPIYMLILNIIAMHIYLVKFHRSHLFLWLFRMIGFVNVFCLWLYLRGCTELASCDAIAEYPKRVKWMVEILIFLLRISIIDKGCLLILCISKLSTRFLLLLLFLPPLEMFLLILDSIDAIFIISTSNLLLF